MFRSVSGLKRKHIYLYIGCVYTARISYLLVGVLNMSDRVFLSKCFLDEPVINRSTSGDFFLFCSESIYRGIFLEVNFIFSFFAFRLNLKLVLFQISIYQRKKMFRILNKSLQSCSVGLKLNQQAIFIISWLLTLSNIH